MRYKHHLTDWVMMKQGNSFWVENRQSLKPPFVLVMKKNLLSKTFPPSQFQYNKWRTFYTAHIAVILNTAFLFRATTFACDPKNSFLFDHQINFTMKGSLLLCSFLSRAQLITFLKLFWSLFSLFGVVGWGLLSRANAKHSCWNCLCQKAVCISK